MHHLRLPFLAAVAATASATASLQHRQDAGITIEDTVLSGSLCSADTVGITKSPEGGVVTVGFDEYIVFVPGEVPSGDCKLNMTVLYPPGCTTARMNVEIHSFLEGAEGVTTTMDVSIGLGTNRQATGTELYKNEGQALEDTAAPYLRSYPLDASISVNQENPAEVALSVLLDARIETESENDGKFSVDDITISFITSELDPDWENCM